jgi:hypothetical protein
MGNRRLFLCVFAVLVGSVSVSGRSALAQIDYGPEILVQADSAEIAVPGYSVPSLVDFDNDGREDLIVGEGSGLYPGQVRLYLNTGTASDPQFSTFSYIKAGGTTLTCTGYGCMGCFPRVVQWDGDAKKDLLVGHSDGTIRLYLNTGADASPVFDGGRFLQVGPPGVKVNIHLGGRPTPSVVDWNNDGRKDLIAGAKDGMIRLFLNAGTDTAPDFHTESRLQAGGVDLIVPTVRASVVVDELTGDGRKDLLVGNTEGQILLYANVGTDASPSFGSYGYVTSEGIAVNLPGTPRARPFLCDWNHDGHEDLLVGAGDGKIHLYLSVSGAPCADFDGDGHVDPDDATRFQLCHSGAGVPLEDPSCAGADLDDDGDADQSDFGLMQRCFGGPDDPPNAECECN